MKTIGIIAEYNPFQNGHAYQLQKIKEETGADHIVIAMSGDFVQRGTPALVDKYLRAKMALMCGASLALELPVLWATASAEDFAMAGVTLFEKMGCVDSICFGAESDNLPLLSSIATILAEESADYQSILNNGLKNGLSFPAARASAVISCCNSDASSSKTTAACTSEELATVLDSPNNILAIEYLKALHRRGSHIKPFLIKREGTGYHDTRIHVDDTINTVTSVNWQKLPPTASATAIRQELLSAAPDWSKISCAMPAAAYTLLSDYSRNFAFLTADHFSAQLGYRLLLEEAAGYQRFSDINTDISNRMQNNRNRFLSFTQFCELNKSRDITYTRMSRALLHLLLNLTDEDIALGKKLDYITYLRILGFRRDDADLLTQIKKTAGVPMLSKLANAEKLLSDDAAYLLGADVFAADLYEQVNILTHSNGSSAHMAKKSTFPRSEYTREIVLV